MDIIITAVCTANTKTCLRNKHIEVTYFVLVQLKCASYPTPAATTAAARRSGGGDSDVGSNARRTADGDDQSYGVFRWNGTVPTSDTAEVVFGALCFRRLGVVGSAASLPVTSSAVLCRLLAFVRSAERAGFYYESSCWALRCNVGGLHVQQNAIQDRTSKTA